MTYLILFISCNKKEEFKKMHNIFKLKMGYNENEIGFFFNKDLISNKILNVYHLNGFYYISDPKNNKIMKLTKSGVPVLIIYNASENPQIKPTEENVNDETGDKEIAYVKLYKEYPIYSPGLIAADVNKNIYIVNNHPDYKTINTDNSIVFSLILKFDKKGNLLYKLGSDGINSNPFGNIINMICDSNNNLIIQEQLKYNSVIYKFSPEGELVLKEIITKEQIPLNDKEKDFIVDIISIKPGYIEDEVLITCQYLKKEIENFSIVSYEVMYEKIFKYSLNNKSFVDLLLKLTPKYIEIPNDNNDANIKKVFGKTKKVLKPMENLLGVDTFGNLYFSQTKLILNDISNCSQNLYIYDNRNKLKNNLVITYPKDIQYSSDLHVSPSGKIYSYYIKDGELQFVSVKE